MKDVAYQDKFRIMVDPGLWKEEMLEESKIDLTGKKIYLFQLPADMPVSCLHGVELPDPRRKKWSKPVSVSYKTDEGTQKELTHTVEIKAQRMKYEDTLMTVTDGKLQVCSSKPSALYQGFKSVPKKEDFKVVPQKETKHELPPGLRQRFTPIGNRNKQSSSHVDVQAIIKSVQTPARKPTKRKSTGEKLGKTPKRAAATPKRAVATPKQQKTPSQKDTPSLGLQPITDSLTKKKKTGYNSSDSEISKVTPIRKSKPTPGKKVTASLKKAK